MNYKQEIEMPTCSVCGHELPTKVMKEKRNSGIYEYTVIDRENLSLYHGRYVHNACNPELLFPKDYKDYKKARKATHGNA